MDRAGLLRCQPQPQRGEDGPHLLAQCLGVVPITGDHENKIIRIADESPVSLAGACALAPLFFCAHLLVPLLNEMIVQCRQGNIGEQRG